MFSRNSNEEQTYNLTEEGSFTYKNGTEYYARVWEDQSGTGKPIIFVNEHFNNQGPALDDKTTPEIGEYLGKKVGYQPTEVHLYQQGLDGSLKGYEFQPYTSERSRVDDMSYGPREEGDKVLGKETLAGHHSSSRPVAEPERAAIESAQGDMRQPWDVNRLEMPKGFDREALRTEYSKEEDYSVKR